MYVQDDPHCIVDDVYSSLRRILVLTSVVLKSQEIIQEVDHGLINCNKMLSILYPCTHVHDQLK